MIVTGSVFLGRVTISGDESIWLGSNLAQGIDPVLPVSFKLDNDEQIIYLGKKIATCKKLPILLSYALLQFIAVILVQLLSESSVFI